MAASGSGLHYLRDMLAGITQFCPGAFLEPVTVKSAMMRLIDSDTSVNGNERNSKTVWAGLKTERLVTVLYHLRRVVRDKKGVGCHDV